MRTPWMRIDELPDKIPDEAWTTSIGYLALEVEDGIWITMGYAQDGQVQCPFFIPKVFLREVSDV